MNGRGIVCAGNRDIDERTSSTADDMKEGFPVDNPSICDDGTDPGGSMEKIYGFTNAAKNP